MIKPWIFILFFTSSLSACMPDIASLADRGAGAENPNTTADAGCQDNTPASSVFESVVNQFSKGC